MFQRALIACFFALVLLWGPGPVHAQEHAPAEITSTTSAELRAFADEKAALLETIDELPEDPTPEERREQVDPVFERLIELRTRVHTHFEEAIESAKAAERPLDKAARAVRRDKAELAVERARKEQLGASEIWKERVEAAEAEVEQSRQELEQARSVLEAYRARVRAYRTHLDFFTDTISALIGRISDEKRAAFFSLTDEQNWHAAVTSLQNGLRSVSETFDARFEQLRAIDAMSVQTLSTETLTWVWGFVWRLAVWLVLLKLLLPLVPAITDGMLAKRVLRRRATLTLKVAELTRALARPIMFFVGVEYLATYVAGHFEEFEALVWVIDAVFIYWTIIAATKVLALPRSHRRMRGHASAAPFENIDEDEANAVADLWVVEMARARKLVRSVRVVTVFWLVSAYVPDFVEPITGITVIWWLVDLVAVWGFIGVVYWVLSQWKDDIAAGFEHLAGDRLASTVDFVNEQKDRPWGVLVIAVASVYVIIKEVGIIARRFVRSTNMFKRISAYVFRTKIELQERDRVQNDGGAPIDAHAKLPTDYLAVFEDQPLTDEVYLVERERYETAIVEKLRAWLDRRRQGSITLVGEPGVGKTTMLDRTAALFAEELRATETDLPVIRATIDHKLVHPADVVRFVCELFDLPETIETQDELIIELVGDKREQTPSRIVLLDDCHNAFTRQIEGFDSLETLLDIVNLCDTEHFFVLTFNKFTWNYVNRIDSREHYFGQVLRLEPFSEAELEELIEARNAYTAFSPSFSELVHDQINHEDYFFEIVKTANGYFRYLHEFSGGNPRIAMVYWLRSLRRRRDDLKILQVSLFERPATGTFSSYTDDHWFILSALAQHGALSAAEIAEVVNLAPGFCNLAVDHFAEEGVVELDDQRRARITPVYMRQVLKQLSNSNFLYG